MPSNGGIVPRLLPSSFLEGAAFRARVCLGCGHVDWFLARESVFQLRD